MLPVARLTKWAADGAVIPLWKVDELRLDPNLQKTVVFMFPDRATAEAGDSTHAATAFWVSVEIAGGYQVFLVTNRHVIEDGSTTFRLSRQTPGFEPFCRETDEGDWYFPTDANVDLAILPIDALPPTVDWIHITLPTMLVKADIEALDVRIGDDVAMIGLHRSYHGGTVNVPSTRFGHLSQFPGQALEDERKRKHPAFLVQVPSMPGYSGSPVYLVQDLAEKDAEHGVLVSGRKAAREVKLLGVNKGHLPLYSPTYMSDSAVRNHALTAEINSGIAMVVPAWEIAKTMLQFLGQKAGLPAGVTDKLIDPRVC